MENTSLILQIVSLILIVGIFFLMFQTWLSMKETKFTLPRMFEDLKTYDTTLKKICMIH